MAGVEGFEPSSFRRNHQVETFLCAHAQLTILTPKELRMDRTAGIEPASPQVTTLSVWTRNAQ